MCKEGYLVRNREMDGGEEVIEYMVGPRGKVEVGETGVAGLVRKVYGRTASVEENGTEAGGDFEKRLDRSLAPTRRDGARVDLGNSDAVANEPEDRSTRGNPARRRSTRNRNADEMDEAY